MKNIFLLMSISLLWISSYSQPATSNYILPYNTQSKILRLQTLYPGTTTDSIVVVTGAYRWLGRVAISSYGFITASYTGFDSRYKPFSYNPAWADIPDRPTKLSNFTNDSGFMSVETDPVWQSVANLYVTKLQSDMLYQPLGSYISIEADPTVSTFVKSITASNFSNGNTAFSWGNHASAGYLTSYTETDPTVPANVKSISSTNMSNWSTAFGWGNHALAGYLTSYTETDPVWLSQKSQYNTVSQDDLRYLRSFTEADPLWTIQKTQYSTTAQSDSKYLQSYTETDPIWLAQKSQYSTKSAADLLYKPISYTYTETDPIWISVSANYRTKVQNDLLYQSLGNYLTAETDPVWIAARGNYSTKVVADGLYKPIGYTPSSAEIIASLGYTPAQVSVPVITAAVTRALNTSYTISTTKSARVYYTIRIAYSITALLGSTGSVDLQYSINSGTTWITLQTVSNSVNLGIVLSGYNDCGLSGEVPVNALVRLNSTVSNATNTYQKGTEVTY